MCSENTQMNYYYHSSILKQCFQANSMNIFGWHSAVSRQMQFYNIHWTYVEQN